MTARKRRRKTLEALRLHKQSFEGLVRETAAQQRRWMKQSEKLGELLKKGDVKGALRVYNGLQRIWGQQTEMYSKAELQRREVIEGL